MIWSDVDSIQSLIFIALPNICSSVFWRIAFRYSLWAGSVALNIGKHFVQLFILLSEDEKPQQWIWIYPIPFRYMDYGKRYSRWSIIKAEISKDEKDSRLESFRANHSII